MKYIKMFKGQLVRVDDDMFDFLTKNSWHIGNSGYAITSVRVGKKSYGKTMHRVIMGAQKGQIVDHIDGDKWNNQKSNLRFCTKSQNAMNSKKYPGKSSQYKGVSLGSSRRGLWSAFIKISGKTLNLGEFLEEKDAALAYDKKAEELFGEFARLNFPVIA